MGAKQSRHGDDTPPQTPRSSFVDSGDPASAVARVRAAGRRRFFDRNHDIGARLCPKSDVKSRVVEKLTAISPEIIPALEEANALVAGGFILSAIHDPCANVDVDVYVHTTKAKTFIEAMLASGWRQRIAIVAPAYDDSFLRRNKILARSRMVLYHKNRGTIIRHFSMDVMVVPADHPLEAVVTNFDLSFCEVWFDALMDLVLAERPDDVMKKEGILNREYVESLQLHRNKFIINRIRKYESRGYAISLPQSRGYAISLPRLGGDAPTKKVSEWDLWNASTFVNWYAARLPAPDRTAWILTSLGARTSEDLVEAIAVIGLERGDRAYFEVVSEFLGTLRASISHEEYVPELAKFWMPNSLLQRREIDGKLLVAAASAEMLRTTWTPTRFDDDTFDFVSGWYVEDAEGVNDARIVTRLYDFVLHRFNTLRWTHSSLLRPAFNATHATAPETGFDVLMGQGDANIQQAMESDPRTLVFVFTGGFACFLGKDAFLEHYVRNIATWFVDCSDYDLTRVGMHRIYVDFSCLGFHVLLPMAQCVDIVLDDRSTYFLEPRLDGEGDKMKLDRTQHIQNCRSFFEGRYRNHDSSNHCQADTAKDLWEVRVNDTAPVRVNDTAPDEFDFDVTEELTPEEFVAGWVDKPFIADATV